MPIHPRGFIPIWLAIALCFLLGGSIAGYYLLTAPPEETGAISVDKTDPQWLKKYCAREVQKLPEAPFTYTSKSEVIETGPLTPVVRLLPQDYYFKTAACRIGYHYEAEPAYASLGVPYAIDIRAKYKFSERTAEILTSKMDPSWKQAAFPEKAGEEKSADAAKRLPLIFTRENADLKTREYVHIYFGIPLYVKLIVYSQEPVPIAR